MFSLTSVVRVSAASSFATVGSSRMRPDRSPSIPSSDSRRDWRDSIVLARICPTLALRSSIAPDTGFVAALPSLILPALTATLVLLAYVARLTRASMLVELNRPYVRTAVLKGVRWRRVVVAHVLPNALLPTITVVAISFGWLISGLIVVENVFNYPGLGRLLTFAIARRDIPLIQAVALVAVLGFALANLVADILYAAFNPRITLR